LIQETHTSDEDQVLKIIGFISGYTIAGVAFHSKYGIATYVRENFD
jgi:hypothetical protein